MKGKRRIRDNTSTPVTFTSGAGALAGELGC